MKRTFLAIAIPFTPALQAVWGELQEAFAAIPTRWVSPSTLHVTLAFIGPTTPAMESSICTLGTAVAAHHVPFRMVVQGVGTFGKPNPKVLWLGVGSGADSLTRLASDICRALTDVGVALSVQNYTPHVTLARFRGAVPPEAPARAVTAFGSLRLLPTEVSEVVFYESILMDGRPPLYRPIASFPLG